jgi:hypothetical protein
LMLLSYLMILLIIVCAAVGIFSSRFSHHLIAYTLTQIGISIIIYQLASSLIAFVNLFCQLMLVLLATLHNPVSNYDTQDFRNFLKSPRKYWISISILIISGMVAFCFFGIFPKIRTTTNISPNSINFEYIAIILMILSFFSAVVYNSLNKILRKDD